MMRPPVKLIAPSLVNILMISNFLDSSSSFKVDIFKLMLDYLLVRVDGSFENKSSTRREGCDDD